MGEASAAPLPTTGRHQRRLRNYLLDSHFQLKYTGYLVGIALLFSISLGLLIWRTSAATPSLPLPPTPMGHFRAASTPTVDLKSADTLAR